MRHFGSLIISFGIKTGWHPQDFRLDDEEGDYEWSRPHGSVSLPVALLRFTPTCLRPAIKLNGAICFHEPIRNEAGPSFFAKKRRTLYENSTNCPGCGVNGF
jgi:hypothetical protein